MKTLLLPIIFLFALTSVSAAQTKTRIRITWDARAVVTVTKGAKSARVDLSKDIAGCPFIEAGRYKRDLKKRGCDAGPASFERVDTTVKDGETFVLLFSRAFGNCNVCGMCGATGAHSLIWIRLGADFKLVKKQAVALESCVDNVALIQPEWQNVVEGSFLSGNVKFSFDNGILTVKYEKSIYSDGGDTTYELSTLVYDRNNPAAGFAVSAKTSKQSAAANQ